MLKTYSLYGFTPANYLNAFLHNLVAYIICFNFTGQSYIIMTIYAVFRFIAKTPMKPFVREIVITVRSGLIIHFISLIDHILLFTVFATMIKAQTSIYVQLYSYVLAAFYFPFFAGKIESFHFLIHSSTRIKYITTAISSIFYGHATFWLKHIHVHHAYFCTPRDPHSPFLNANAYRLSMKIWFDNFKPESTIPFKATLFYSALSITSMVVVYLTLGQAGLVLYLLVSYAVLLSNTIAGTIHHFGIYRTGRSGRNVHYSVDNEEAINKIDDYPDFYHANHHIKNNCPTQASLEGNHYISCFTIHYGLAYFFLLFNRDKYLQMNHKNLLLFIEKIGSKEEISLMKTDLLKIKEKKRAGAYWRKHVTDFLNRIEIRLTTEPTNDQVLIDKI